MSKPRTTTNKSLQKIEANLERHIHSMDHAEGRENGLNDDFVRLEGEIAAIIFGLSGAVSIFGTPAGLLLATKAFFISGWVCLCASLVFGLLGIRARIYFWQQMMRNSRVCYDAFAHARDGNEDADFAASVARSVHREAMAVSPKWPHIWQTLTLVFGVLLVFTGLAIHILHLPSPNSVQQAQSESISQPVN